MKLFIRELLEDENEDVAGLEPDQWLDFSTQWTRRESKAIDSATIQEIIDQWLPKKLVGMRIVTSSGLVVTDPKELKMDAEWFDDLDQRVYGALANSVYKCLSQLFFLGAAIVKPSSLGTENAASVKKNRRN